MDESRSLLLDRYSDAVVDKGNALQVTVTRTRSRAGRDLLAFLASRRERAYDELIRDLYGVDLGDQRVVSELSQSLDTEWLAYLGQVVAVQGLSEADRGQAIRIYEVLEAVAGRTRMSARDAKLFADSLMTEGRFSDVADRMWDLPVTARDRTQLSTDLANPFIGTGTESAPTELWLRLFEEAMGYDPPERRLDLLSGDALPFDRLTSRRAPRISRGPLVSVIITSYRPDDGLLTAVRSIVEQSWEPMEILVVDDGSPPEFSPLLERVEGLDERIRVIRTTQNRGTYNARNVGLAVAAGEFVTLQDSDDWSHPRRIELQVKPMIADSSLVATTSTCVRATPNLSLTSTGYQLFRLNTSSLMIRLKPVVGTVGFMDGVRKAADTEYLKRVEAAFDGGYKHLCEPALAVVRLVPDSLSRSEFRPGWHHPARIVYREGYEAWHQRIRRGESPYVEMNSTRRPFTAPMRFMSQNSVTLKLGFVVVADWRQETEPPLALLDDLRDVSGSVGLVGAVHMDSYRDATSTWPRPYGLLQRMAREEKVALVQIDDPLEVETVVVADPEVLQFPSFGQGAWSIGRLVILVEEPPADVEGSEALYLPEDCHDSALRIFGQPPVWLPGDEDVRTRLEGRVPDGALAEVGASFPRSGLGRRSDRGTG